MFRVDSIVTRSLLVFIISFKDLVESQSCQIACIPQGKSCQSLYKLDFEKTKKQGACSLLGVAGQHTAYCCQSEEVYNKFKEKRRLTELSRALSGAEQNEYPHQVQFRGSDKKGRCGGTVYNKNWVITGAHCIRYKGVVIGKPGISYVIAGHSFIGSAPKEDKYTVADIIVHEDFDEEVMGKGNDIALLRLERPLKLKRGRIQPLKLESAEFVPNYGGHGVFIGWGNVHDKLGDGTFDLMESYAQIHEVTKAARLSWDNENGTESPYFNPLPQHLSIGGDDSGVTVGQGDSGGPFICADQESKPVLCGIASFKRCHKFKTCRRPNWYVRVAPFLSWIQEKTNNASQEKDLIFDEVMFPKKLSDAEIPNYLVRIIGKRKSCTGALVGTQRNVITAADCMLANDQDISKVNHVLFVHHFRSGKMFQLRGAYVDTHYQDDISEKIRNVLQRALQLYDLAVFELEHPAEGSVPLELPPDNYQISSPAIEYTMNEKVSSVEARKYHPMSAEECERKLQAVDPSLDEVHPDYLCMRQVYSAEAECERDEGAPLVCGGKFLCGIKTFQACKFSGFPEIFSNTLNGPYMRYIVQQTIRWSLRQN